MTRPGRKQKPPAPLDASDPHGFPVLIAQYLEHLRLRNSSPRTVMNCPSTSATSPPGPPSAASKSDRAQGHEPGITNPEPVRRRRSAWNVEALQASKEIILCEALLDALTFWCAGFRNVTASYGVEGFTEDHLAAFQRTGTERVLIAYDRDDAGDKAAEKLAEKLIAAGIECFRVQFPKGMDANDYALKVTPPGG